MARLLFFRGASVASTLVNTGMHRARRIANGWHGGSTRGALVGGIVDGMKRDTSSGGKVADPSTLQRAASSLDGACLPAIVLHR